MKINDIKYTGLTASEIQKRISEGKVNITKNNLTKTYKDILLSNTFTFFNMINLFLLFLVLLVNSYKNTLFIFIITINTTAGIYQEIKAKRTLDKLSILTTSAIDVLRDGQLHHITIDELVIDDTMVLVTGNQIPADATIIEGQLEVNEALLTGEIDGIVKLQGDSLYSGSFVTSGKAMCKVIHVGEDNYMQQITKEAKKFKKHPSQLNHSINRILKIISIIIVPLAVLLFLKQFYISNQSFENAILNTVAAALGMIPEGLVLLTSIALTISVLRLAAKKTLVQELFCIETLARVDVLCLDKTGTITEGEMFVEEVDVLKDVDIDAIIGNLLYCLEDSNVTSVALQNHFPLLHTYTPHYVIPFSSKRKYSGVSFVGKGSYYLGAMQFLFPHNHSTVKNKCEMYATKGYRVLVLAQSTTITNDESLPEDLEPCALLLITETIRKEAKETLQYFHNQGVQCKVISGDDSITVSSITKKAGLYGAEAYVDATTLKTKEDIQKAVKEFHVFGRVTPNQKKEMVVCLKELGHTVAMTGDGVNDVLALKESDCSIAMASGSDAAKQAANLVLLDNNFSAMPHIVNEGRRVINNIQLSASMFLIKTIFSCFIAVATLFVGQTYPFQPLQLSIISACCVGIPSFFLAYESNFKKIEGRFLRSIFAKAFPPALVISIGTTLIMNVGLSLGHPRAMLSTMCIIFTAWNYMLALKNIYSPLSVYRKYVLYSSQLLYFVAMVLGQEILSLGGLGYTALIILIGLLKFSSLFNLFASHLFDFCLATCNAYQKRRMQNSKL